MKLRSDSNNRLEMCTWLYPLIPLTMVDKLSPISILFFVFYFAFQGLWPWISFNPRKIKFTFALPFLSCFFSKTLYLSFKKFRISVQSKILIDNFKLHVGGFNYRELIFENKFNLSFSNRHSLLYIKYSLGRTVWCWIFISVMQ